MNSFIETILDHRSIRSYLDKPVEENKLEAILDGVQAAPTSINGQQLSVIVVQDKIRKKKLSALAGGQVWIDQAPVFLVFVADFYKTKIAADKMGTPLAITDSVEATMVASVDVGIAMGNAIGIAESLELGIVPIGGIRRDPKAVIELLNLPEYVFPVAGLVVGYPKDRSAKKPRMPKEAVIHREVYNKQQKPIIDSYDELMSTYMEKRTGGKENRNWSQTVSNVYSSVYFPNVYPVLKEQGFKNEC